MTMRFSTGLKNFMRGKTLSDWESPLKEPKVKKSKMVNIGNVPWIEESAPVTEEAWKSLKSVGELHHKTGTIEPIDLYKAGGILKSFAIASIIKYAFRNRNRKIVEKDLDKIIHYAGMLRVLCHEGE